MNRKICRITCFFISCLFLFASLASSNVIFFSTATIQYNRTLAMDYACNNYKNNDSKECAEFVSDCLKYGGLPISGSKSCSRLVEQLGALGLVRYELTKRSNGVVYYSDNIGKIEEGDPIFWYCNNCGVYPHAVLCYSDEKTNKDGKVYYCGHNNSNINSPLNNSCLCWGCKNPLIFYSYHIPNASTEYGRINVTMRHLTVSKKYWLITTATALLTAQTRV